MTFTWQYNNKDYNVSTTEEPLFGKIKIGDIIAVKCKDGIMFYLKLKKIVGNEYQCNVVDTYVDK